MKKYLPILLSIIIALSFLSLILGMVLGIGILFFGGGLILILFIATLLGLAIYALLDSFF